MAKARTIGIISIKGGVGKTSVVANLGAVLAKDFSKKVLVIDANFSAPNLNLHFGLVNPKATIHDVMNERIKISEALYKHSSGVHIIPGSLLNNSLSFRKINPFKLRQKIAPLKEYFDLILIDSSPSLNEELVSTMLASDELLVITSPDYSTLACTLHAIKMAKQKRTPISGLIINRARNKKFELTSKEIEEITNVPILSTISEDIKLPESLSFVTPVNVYAPTSKISIEYKKLAASLTNEEFRDPRLFAKIARLGEVVGGLFKMPKIKKTE